MRIRLVFLAGVGVALIGGGMAVVMAQGPTDSQLDGDLAAVQAQISEAVANADQYTSGAIKGFALLRVQVLKSTEAMLQQKRLSILRGITLVYRDEIPRAALDGDLALIDEDIEKAKGELHDAEAEAGRYSGGLLGTIALVRVATSRMTVVALEQQKLLRRYGIAIPLVKQAPQEKPHIPGVVVKDKDAL